MNCLSVVSYGFFPYGLWIIISVDSAADGARRSKIDQVGVPTGTLITVFYTL